MDSRAFCFPKSHVSHSLLERAWFAEPGADFKHAMYDCGQALAAVMIERTETLPEKVCIMSPGEDADGIAKGVTDYLQSKGIQVRLLCLWNRLGRVFAGGVEVAPILRTFAEPGYDECEHLVAVQSFLGNATVLKTNITAHLKDFPQKIHILAPAMYAQLQSDLIKEFPASVSERFELHTFVYDSELDVETGELKPGIGGVGPDRMGLPHDKPYMDFPLSVMDLLRR